MIVTDSTLVLNISSTAALTSGLVARSATRNTYWRCLSATRVLFSETTGAITTFISRSAGYFLAAVMRASPRSLAIALRVSTTAGELTSDTGLVLRAARISMFTRLRDESSRLRSISSVISSTFVETHRLDLLREQLWSSAPRE